MKRLTLMRHADAQWKDPEVADFARPLNRRGHSEAEAMARRLIELKLDSRSDHHQLRATCGADR